MKAKQVLIFVSMFSSVLFGRVNAIQKAERADSVRVVCMDMHKTEGTPAYYLNGIFVGDYIQWVDPEEITHVYVEKQKKNSMLYNKEYPGKVFLTLKDSLPLDLMTLDEIRNKFIKFDTNNCIFMINHDLFTGNADESKIDINHILRIEVAKLKTRDIHSGQMTEVNVIEILTKTKENIKKSKDIRLRGSD